MSDETTESTTSRRGFLGRAGLVSAALVGGAAAGAGVAAATDGGGSRSESLTVDVACLGNTWREASAIQWEASADSDIRNPFRVEGLIYPEGTISGDGFIPTSAGAIGTWFCRGWVILHSERPEPHVSSSQDFLFGSITKERLFPPDMIGTQGIEGTTDDAQVAARYVVGGTGEYLGASGACTQANLGLNTTVFPDGSEDLAPNFKFDFQLILPS